MKKIFTHLLFLIIVSTGLNAQDTVSINTENFSNYLTQSRHYFKEYRYNKAMGLLEKLYAFDTTNIQVTNQLAEFYLTFNNKRKAVFYLGKTLSQDSLNLFALLSYGDLLLRDGDPGNAEEFYYRVIQYVDSDNYYAYRQIANIYYSMGGMSFPLAIDYYTKAVKSNPYDLPSYSKMGNIYNMLGQSLQADSICNIALKIDSLNSTVLNIKGYALYNLKLYLESIKTFDKVLQKKDSTAFNLKYTGLAYMSMNNFEKSKFFFERCIKFDTTDYEPFVVLGQLYLQTKEFEKGIACLNRAERINYPPPQKWSEMFKIKADIYNQLNRWDEAMECYKQGYKLNPNDITLVCKMAYQYDYLKQREKAISYYTQVIENADSLKYPGEVKLAKDRLQKLQLAKGRK